MRSHRGILVLFVSVALLAAGGVAASVWLWPGLPDPAVADRDGLLRWLVARDLSAESAETRRTLALRLDDEFSSGIDWQETTGQLDDAQRQRVWENILVLLEPWFMEKADVYAQLDDAKRPEYVDQLIDSIAIWQGADSLQPQGNAATDQPEGLLSILFEQVEQWQQDADPQRRERIGQFLLAIKKQWALRAWRAVMSESS